MKHKGRSLRSCNSSAMASPLLWHLMVIPKSHKADNRPDLPQLPHVARNSQRELASSPPCLLQLHDLLVALLVKLKLLLEHLLLQLHSVPDAQRVRCHQSLV